MNTQLTIKNSAEQARIDKWQTKRAQENPGFLYQQIESTDNKSANAPIQLTTALDTKDLSPTQQAEIQHATMCAISGSANSDYGRMLFQQTLGGFFKAEDYATIANAVNSALLAMAPADIIEGQLCARLLVLNNQIAEYMARAAIPDQTTALRDLNLNRATKLMRVYNETVDTLNKHRRKGIQIVTVQHINVNGGRAIVAQQLNPGEVTGKK